MKFHSTPAWSMHPRHTEKQRERSPGPGAYNPKGGVGTAGPKLGSGNRSNLVGTNSNPGPGTYSPKERPKSSGVVCDVDRFGTGVRQKITKGEEIPGPGTYSVPSKLTEGPSWGIKGRYKNPSTDQKPVRSKQGPGAYDHIEVTVQNEHVPSYSFPKSTSRSEGKGTKAPGPGEYSPARKKESPSWVFGKEAKGEPVSRSKEFPAPGNYDIPGSMDRRSFSISGRHPDPTEKRTAFVPGPGAYAPVLRSDNPQFSVGRGTRWKDDKRKGETPGPGAYYQNNRPRSTSAVVGTGRRQGIAAPSTAPGPGTYTVQKEKEGPQFSFGGRHPIPSKMNTPGPGQYDQNQYAYVLERPASAVWGASKQEQKEKKFNQTLPGPGEYSPATKSAVGPNYSFGNEQRKWLKEDKNPGPGTYAVSAPADHRAASISGRHPIKDYKVVPGPGTYDVHVQKQTPSFSVGRGNRSELANAKEMPGPGQYPVPGSLSRNGVRIGTGTRDVVSARAGSPGPGAYTVGSSVGEGPSYSLRGKYYHDQKQENPGPGQYNHDVSSVLDKSPSVQFGRETKDNLKELKSTDTTGPGMYYSPEKPAGVKWSFGSEKRGTKVKEANPGPGTYDLKPTIPDLPSYSVQSK